jgi:hypothetical protein
MWTRAGFKWLTATGNCKVGRDLGFHKRSQNFLSKQLSDINTYTFRRNPVFTYKLYTISMQAALEKIP